jgi:ABC-type transporter MlaC component
MLLKTNNNGKPYIGVTNDIKRRKIEHVRTRKINSLRNRHIVLGTNLTEQQAKMLEKLFIYEYWESISNKAHMVAKKKYKQYVKQFYKHDLLQLRNKINKFGLVNEEIL